MPSTLELNLVSDTAGIKLSSTRFKNDETGLERQLVVSGEEQRVGFEPAKSERIRYGVPQRAMLILLLRGFSSQFLKYSLATEESPLYARSLLNIWHKQQTRHDTSKWLYTLVGLRAGERLVDWFDGEGSTSPARRGRILLGLKWKSIKLVVKVNNAVIPDTEYEKLAGQIEQDDRPDKPAAKASIERFELRVWNGALGCFSRECNGVKHGDRVQLHIQAKQPAHLYVLWLDQSGKVVTLHPWSDPDWSGLIGDAPAESLIIPDSNQDGESATLRVEGAAGVDTIMILARSEPISRKEAQMIRGMIEGSKSARRCPKCEVLVVSKFDGTPRLEKPARSIRRLTASPDVKTFQAGLAANFTPHFDQVMICSFTNEGKGG